MPSSEYPSAMREMPENERPRERLAQLGPEVLRDAELIAILFRSGTRSQGAVALAEQALRHFGDLRALSQASLSELQHVKGMGEVKAIELKAALELGKRLALFTGQDKPRIHTAQDVVDLLMVRFKDLEEEHFKCILLSTKNDVLRVVDVAKGGLDGVEALPRDVYRQAVREGASAVVVCHNHPSGDPQPSRSDTEITKRLKQSAEVLGIRFLDHIIFGDGKYISFKEQGLL